MKVTITLTEEMLGMTAGNPEIASEFQISRSADAQKQAEEEAALSGTEIVEKSMTVFPKENGIPFMWDYQIKGMFKDSCNMLHRVKTSESAKLKAYKKVIDGLIFVTPRKILMTIPEGMKMGTCQRALRGQTPQGERIALANSETVPLGTTFTFEVECLDKSLEKNVKEWLNYSARRGMGQWRNSGKGRHDVVIS